MLLYANKGKRYAVVIMGIVPPCNGIIWCCGSGRKCWEIAMVVMLVGCGETVMLTSSVVEGSVRCCRNSRPF
jgi:hypothetical protein